MQRRTMLMAMRQVTATAIAIRAIRAIPHVVVADAVPGDHAIPSLQRIKPTIKPKRR